MRNKSTLVTFNVKAKIVGSNFNRGIRYWIGLKLMHLASRIMKTKIEVSVEQENT